MNWKTRCITAALGLMFVTAQAQTQPLTPTLANQERAPVSWQQPVALNPALLKSLRPAAHSKQSTAFHLDASGAELRQGVPLQLSGPEAVVMLSRLDRPKAATPTATLLFAGQKSRHVQAVVDAEALAATGWLAGQHLAMKLDGQAPAGIYTLQLPKAAADSRWIISVQDRNSPWKLEARIENQALLAGDTVTLKARWLGEAKLEQVQGFLIAPDGQPAEPVQFKRQADGSFIARFPAPVSEQPGLWDVQILSRGATEKGPLLRDLRLAFASARATAHLDGTPQWRDGSLRLSLKVAEAGRYAVHALLAVDAENGLKVEHARWLEPGLHTLEIPVAGLGKSARLLALRLQDQSRLGDLGQWVSAETVEDSLR